jgi:hypothetical protein
MPDRRGRKSRAEGFLPADRVPWARRIWAEQDEVAKTDPGMWMLREAARILGLPEEAVDEVLKRQAR